MRGAFSPRSLYVQAASYRPSVPCPICDSIKHIRSGHHPFFIAELSESFVVLGENQGCRGWCVLYLKEHADHLADLFPVRQAALFDDVARVAAAQRRSFGPIRINYECLGNQVSHVHWHVIPRHADDPTPKETVWGWDAARLRGEMTEQQRRELAARLRASLVEVM